VTPRHNKYVLVMIEHFSKWIELVALPDKFSEEATYSFLDRVLSRFGAPAEAWLSRGRFQTDGRTIGRSDDGRGGVRDLDAL
jgi:hypothetical protein